MRKIKYLLKRIIQLDYKNMFRIAKNLSKKTGKSYIGILLDMVRCGLKYQAGYYDYQEFEFYNLNKEERKTYLTRGKNNEIVRRFNNKDSFHIFENKDEFYTNFDKFVRRKWMKLDENNQDEFIKFLKENKQVIVKPVDGEGGQGVEKIKYQDEDDAKAIYKKLLENKQTIVEQCIVQNEKLNELYDKSVNSLRCLRFIKMENLISYKLY